MGAWLIIVYVLLPIPFFILLTLSLPFPSFIRSYILKFTDLIIFMKVWGDTTVYQILVGVSLVLFGLSVSDTVRSRSNGKHEETMLLHDKSKCLRWRSERNFWITFLSLILWVILFRVRSLVKEVDSLRRAAAPHTDWLVALAIKSIWNQSHLFVLQRFQYVLHSAYCCDRRLFSVEILIY